MAIKNKTKNSIDSKMKMSKKSVNPVIVGAAGAAVGAGIGVAATVVMNDEKNRKKVVKVVDTVKKQAREYMESIKDNGTIEKGKELVKDSVRTATQQAKDKEFEMIDKTTDKLLKPQKSKSQTKEVASGR